MVAIYLYLTETEKSNNLRNLFLYVGNPDNNGTIAWDLCNLFPSKKLKCF